MQAANSASGSSTAAAGRYARTVRTRARWRTSGRGVRRKGCRRRWAARRVKRTFSGVASFRIQPAASAFQAEIQGQLGRGKPLGRSPLPRISWDRDSGMQQGQSASRIVDCGGDQVTPLLQGSAEGRLQKIKHVHTRARADPTNHQVVFKAERAGGIAKCGVGRRRGHATSLDSPALVVTGSRPPAGPSSA